MITKRRKFIAIILLAVIGGVIAYPLLRRDDEPTYQGRRLSQWLANYVETTNGHEAEIAVRNIGTNALPCLLKWTDYEPPSWRAKLVGKLPEAIQEQKMVSRWLEEDKAELRAHYAFFGYGLLGTNAASAIPELEALMKNSTRPIAARSAICALGSIGEPALPALRAGLANTNQAHLEQVITVLRWMGHVHGTNACLPVLIEALNHNDVIVRIRATNALKTLAPETFANATPD